MSKISTRMSERIYSMLEKFERVNERIYSLINFLEWSKVELAPCFVYSNIHSRNICSNQILYLKILEYSISE